MEDDSVAILVGWLIFSLIVGAVGADRTLGFWGAFLISLLLSPLIGLIFVLTSRTNAQKVAEMAAINASIQRASQTPAAPIPPPFTKKTMSDVHAELEKLELMKEKKLITDNEYEEMRKQVLKL